MSLKPIKSLLIKAKEKRMLSIVACVHVAVSLPAVADSIARTWNEQNLAAIRTDIPHPPVHARNLFHVSVAMWDAWAAYDPLAVGYVHNESAIVPDPDGDGVDAADITAAREEAISFAAYRVLVARYANSVSALETAFNLAQQMATLGYDATDTSIFGDAPSNLGNRIAESILGFFLDDGANEAGDYEDFTYSPFNDPLPLEESGATLVTIFDVNRWAPLAFGDFALTQNGIQADLIQTFQGSQWWEVRSFALSQREHPDDPYLDPGPPPQLGGQGDEEFKDNINDVLRYSSLLDPADPATINISPGIFGNNVLGRHDGNGHGNNPVTGQPYADNIVKHADYGRVIAEFWADGPSSETPPGHWNVVGNEVTDHPDVVFRIGGSGPIVDKLEWDVKRYMAMNGAMHDAATAAWTCKRVYDYGRPIVMCRYMGLWGQSSDPDHPDPDIRFSYNSKGMKLEPGLVEVITSQTSAPGERHEHLNGYIGSIAVRSWAGEPADPETEVGGVDWILAKDWLPYQRDTFVTPAFAAYVSGHSCFSRAGAEVLSLFTGSPYFPGGLAEHTEVAGSLDFELGPSSDVTLQWASYYDAADEAGISRLYGGIHVSPDDLPGRVMGSEVGIAAYHLASKYWDGSILSEPMALEVAYDESTEGVNLSWLRTIGLFDKLQSSTDFVTWTDLTAFTKAVETRGQFSESVPALRSNYYRVVRSATGF
ncbi:MAG: vanadium-dependent haloperoxidase [Verrucomicrobiaceae bacterium]|nr:vanadium-dependent haloperoxidase [Verrucomicrobiaceae bacterium]